MANLFNTRIRLRYDLYTEWAEKNPVLLAGEVAIAVPGTNLGSVETAASCLMKVGNGTAHFNDLPWMSAIAADVHSWAKLPFDKFTELLNNGTLTYNEVTYTCPAFATDAELATLAGRVTAIENELNTAETGLKARVTTLEGEMDTAQSDIGTISERLTTLENTTGTDGLTGRVGTLETKVGALEEADTAQDGKITANENAIAAEETARKQAIAAEQTARGQAITDAIAAEVEDRNEAISSAIATEVTNRDNAIAAAVKVETDRATGAETALGNRLTTAEGKLDTLTGTGDGSVAKALADAKAYTDEVKADLLGEGELVDTYDTLKEIGDWINTSGVDATELSSAIAEEAASRIAADNKHTEDITNLRTDLTTLTNNVGTVPEGKTVIGLIGSVTEGKTLMDLIGDNTTAIATGDEATLTAAKKYTDDKIVEVNGANSALAGRVDAVENILEGIGGEGDTDTTVIAAITAAENRAKSYAEEKASAAQAAAEATAAADATAKANQAKADAIADADAKFTTTNARVTALENFDKTAITGKIESETLTMSLDGQALDLIFVCGNASTN